MEKIECINTYDQLKEAFESGLIKKEQAVAVSYYRTMPRDVKPNGSSVWKLTTI